MTEDQLKTLIITELKKIAPESDPGKLNPDENIRQSLDIDSFDFLQFIIALDNKTGITVPEEDYGKISSIKNLTGYLHSKLMT